MEAHHDLRKFITELTVAQRCVVLSSGREVDCVVDPRRVTVQYQDSSDDRAGVGTAAERIVNQQCGAAHSGGGDRELDDVDQRPDGD
ncbi:hypothetical protein ACQP2Y_00570 [Actinoplanes sp. CA-051413]|uniref:hypothetical protein n=1 Tax=Actinoplanes sp. CA-051413 TaxID=3239899 RepID=UPI003D989B52